MSINLKIAFVTLLCLLSIKGYAFGEVWDTMELMNAVSEDGKSLIPRTMGLTGKGVGIAVIDYTVNSAHPVLKDAKIINCGTPEKQKELKNVHGQYVATPIVGISYPEKLSLNLYDQTTRKSYDVAYWGGLTPEATVYSYPYITNTMRDNTEIIGVLGQILEKNLEIAREGEGVAVKLINMSFVLTSEFKETNVVRQFNQVREAGILAIHAAGNDSSTMTIRSDSIRAADNWIEVGALSSFKSEKKYHGWKTSRYDSGSNYPHPDSVGNFMWAPGHIIAVAGGEKGPCLKSGSSFAAPQVTSASGLAWEKDPGQDYHFIRDRLMSCPIYDISMSSELWDGDRLVEKEYHTIQKPILDIRHLLGS